MGKTRITQQTAEEALKESQVIESAAAKVASKGSSKKVQRGRVYIKSSYNNTIVTITNEKGEVVSWASAGSLGFSGPKKATPFAASKVVNVLAEKMKKFGPVDIDVFVNGIGAGRDSAIRSLVNHGFNILSIKDVTPIPHNGPRPPKARRV